VRRSPLALIVVSAVAPLAASCGSSNSSSATGTTTTSAQARVSHPPNRRPKAPPSPNSPAARQGASNVRLPAVYTILPGEKVSPGTVSAPAGVTIDLRVSSGDSRPHHVVLHTPGDPILTVPAKGSASLTIASLKNGHYALYVDGTDRAALIVGVAPGP
jgi:hypothetical protein